MGFDAGDVVVAPGCGVGVIEDVEVVDLNGIDVEMYRIYIETTGMRMWIPIHRASVDGIRPPMQPADVDTVLSTIRETTAPEQRTNWNRRQRRYRELLMSNDPLQMAELVGELASVRHDKVLSFGERRLYEQALALIRAELEVACTESEGLEDRLEDALAA
ncbi:MAG: CarD family transcriptional regulator [Myxococcota bacterium]